MSSFSSILPTFNKDGRPSRNQYPRNFSSAYSVAPSSHSSSNSSLSSNSLGSSAFFARVNPKSRYPLYNRDKRGRKSNNTSIFGININISNFKMALNSRILRLLVALTVAVVIFLLIASSSSSSSTTNVISSLSQKATSASHIKDLVGEKDGDNSSKSVADNSDETEESGDSFSCTKSFDGVKPVNQYVVMIDAGSSGSRVHVYHFNNCLSSPRLVKEEFKMLQPGLSSYKDDPEAAAKSLDPLLDLAVESVPVDSRGCTPIAVKATAGLRLIGAEAANKTLAAVRAHLENDYPFAVVSEEHDGVAIMPGADEGVYAWVTVNYLLGNIVSDPKNKIPIEKRPPTAAVFDLGGGSTQIVFEPRFPVSTQKMAKGDHRYDIKFGANQYTLYQHSHLGYGLNVARDSMYSSVVSSYLNAGKDIQTTTVVNPCLPPNASLTDVKVKVGDKSYVVPSMIGPKESSMLQCQKVAETLLNKELSCPVEPCSFNGIYQPSLVSNFGRDSDLYVISYFYDRTFPLGMPMSFNIDDMKDLAQKVCRGPEAYDSFEAIPDAIKELKENPEWCGDLSYMLAVLHHGYDIPVHREVKIAKKVKGNELGWCLGASLPLLDNGSGWTCRIKQQQEK